MSNLSFALLVSTTGCCGQMSSNGGRYIGYANEGHLRTAAVLDCPDVRANSEWGSMILRTRQHARGVLNRGVITAQKAETHPLDVLPFTRAVVEIFVLKHSNSKLVRDLTVDGLNGNRGIYFAVQPLVEQLVTVVLETVEEFALERATDNV